MAQWGGSYENDIRGSERILKQNNSFLFLKKYIMIRKLKTNIK